MEYYRTRDILHVMQMLGHKSIRNTLMDTQLVDFKEDDYIARIAHSEEETCQLIEAGFEFVCDFGINKVFKKTQVTPAQNGRGLSMAGGRDLTPRPGGDVTRTILFFYCKSQKQICARSMQTL